jgi:phosphatidate cytidylyltransferase
LLGLRILSSVIIIPPLIAAIWYGGYSYMTLIVLVGGAIGWELARLATARSGLVVNLNVFFMACTPVIVEYIGVIHGFIWILIGVIGFAVITRSHVQSLAEQIGFALICALGHLALLSLVWLRFGDARGAGVVFYVVLVIAATDIGGYFAGKGIGGPKLAPSISPNKTWAGLIGGMALAGIAGFGFVKILSLVDGWHPDEKATDFLVATIILSVVLAPVAQLGDLLESWIKRKRGAKDSGNLIPGHGGILDRIDGYLTAVPLVALITLMDKGGPFAWL